MNSDYIDNIVVNLEGSNGDRLQDLFDIFNSIYGNAVLTEAEYTDQVNKFIDKEHLRFEVLDIDRFIKANDCQEVTNSIFFNPGNTPTDDGLLSNKIFGITMEERSNIFAYISLEDWFLDPSCYKTWIRIDSKIRDIVHHIDTFKVAPDGSIVQDPNGETGVEFLKKNIDKIKFKSTESIKRDIKIQYLEHNKTRMFINKYIIIPPFYRDVNTSKGGTVGVSGINELYRNIILAVSGLKSIRGYGFDNSGAVSGQVQELLLQVYDWFCGNNSNLTVETGVGISGKLGIMRRANMSKTTNYSSRMVIASPELKVESVDDMMVNLDHTAIPLAACLANYRTYIIFHVKRLLEEIILASPTMPFVTADNPDGMVTLKDPLIEFSDEKIKREMDRFIHGYNNRLVPIEIPVVEKVNSPVYFYASFEVNGIEHTRMLTWCDLFYMAAVEATKDKVVIITRYPMDSYFNQITTGVVVSSTVQTEPVIFHGTYYPYYPKIDAADIGSNTGNMFVDTLKMSNLYLDGLGADYDGDTVTAKSPYLIESIEEAKKFMNSKANFIDLGGTNIKIVEKDVVQTLYSMTKILENTKLTDPKF